ncbi:MAG: 16S rRNA (adenine(1518)-N(6)/adenine(1519)-N(6))-dimethyltransferase RsmA [Clostridiales bacterium]|nr:16S rRNA (adenine(1518)-N(6)/adenine(1519)-N(6))-dimethyltransferase RsmA [Clostridiales bacterium]
MDNLENKTREIMRKYGVVAEKRLGQNFLIDENAIAEIVRSSNISNNDLIIEIGPGLGTLTEKLVEKAGKVICIELDRRMISILEDRFKDCNNIQIIYGDILKINLKELLEENSQFENVRVVANLPYYITTPIIMKLLEEKLNIDTITIMIQKEVADRIVALPGGKDYGVLTLSTSYYASSEIVVQVSHEGFIPAPKVDSTVVLLKVYKKPIYDIKDETLLFNIIKGGFIQRRKMFANSIESCLKKYNIDKETFKQILDKYDIDETRRAETLSMNDFINISNEIYDILN